MGLLKKIFSNKNIDNENIENDLKKEKHGSQDSNPVLPINIGQKLQLIENYINNSSDIIVRHFIIKYKKDIDAAVIFMEGVTDVRVLNENILKPLIDYNVSELRDNRLSLLEDISKEIVSVGKVKLVDTFTESIQSIFDGLTVIIVDGFLEVIIVDIRGGEQRTLDEPLLDRTICGPREGFVENISTNITLIRRKLKDPNLAAQRLIVGVRTRTDVAILYIKDIANPEIVDDIIKRIKEIKIDGVLSTGYLNQFIEDNPHSLFPLYREVERADIAVAELLEGRVVILADQSPLAIVYPALFVEMFQAAEDYYTKYQQGNFMRIFRYLAFFSAISLPALYISLISFNQELIPYKLIIPIAELRSQLPFSSVIEIILIEVIVQIIFEAGLRMPAPLGQTIGVVGGIVLGQALITSNIAGPVALIVVTTATISAFAIPNFCMAVTARILGFIFILASSIFGIFGFIMSWLFLIIHLISQKSMGIPHFAPYAPLIASDLKDSFFRFPIRTLKTRPDSINNINKIRQGDNKKNKDSRGGYNGKK